jgi:hypothetical protein
MTMLDRGVTLAGEDLNPCLHGCRLSLLAAIDLSHQHQVNSGGLRGVQLLPRD